MRTEWRGETAGSGCEFGVKGADLLAVAFWSVLSRKLAGDVTFFSDPGRVVKVVLKALGDGVATVSRDAPCRVRDRCPTMVRENDGESAGHGLHGDKTKGVAQ